VKLVLFWSIGIFALKTLMKHEICSIGWLRILMNLRVVVLILSPHPPVSPIMLFLCMKFAIVPAMTVILILVIFLLMVLLDFPA